MKNWIKEGNTVATYIRTTSGEKERRTGIITAIHMNTVVLNNEPCSTAKLMLEPCLQWHKIDPDNLPEHEVLAVNFTPDTLGYKKKMLGEIRKSLLREGKITCTSKQGGILLNCTHYIDIHQYDLEE